MLKASWIITTKCNFNCIHCYLGCTSREYEHVNLKDGRKIIDTFEKLGVKLVFISGGEPLLHPQFFELMSFLKKYKMLISLCTNGSLITSSVAKKLKKSGINDVSIGIESASQKTFRKFRGDNFQRVIDGIKNCVENDIGVSLDVTMTALNKRDIWDLIEFGKKQKTLGIVLKRFIPLGRGKVNSGILEVKGEEYLRFLRKWLEESLKTKEGNFQLLAHEPLFSVLINTTLNEVPWHLRTFSIGCRAGIVSFGVYLNGNFSYCPIISKFHSLGNILEMDVEKINKILKSNPIRKKDKHEGLCKTCAHFAYCRGCRTYAFATSGDLLKDDAICFKRITEHV